MKNKLINTVVIPTQDENIYDGKLRKLGAITNYRTSPSIKQKKEEDERL